MALDQSLAKKVIEKYTRETDPEIIDATYQYGADYIAPIPYPTRGGIAEVLKLNRAFTPKPKQLTRMILLI
jgi:hypothetical protein